MRFPRGWVLSLFCFLSMSCIAYHVIMCISFAYMFISCIRAFSPLSILQSDTPTCTGVPPFVSFCERVLDILGMDQDFPSGLGTPLVDRLSSFVSFGVRLILQRLTRESQRPPMCCSPTPLQNGPITHPDLLRVPRHPSQTLFRLRVLNFLGMARALPSGLGISPVDRLSSFVPFGVRLMLQRLTGEL